MTDHPVPPEAALEVIDLLGRYCTLIDHGSFEELAELFTPEGRMEMAGQTMSGRAEISRFMAEAPKGIHLVGIPAISAAGEGVTAASAFQFIESSTGMQLIGYYHDEIVRTGGRLHFASRRIEMKRVPKFP